MVDEVNMLPVNLNNNENMSMDNKAIEELDRVIKHLSIGGKCISAYDYVVRSETECLII